MFLSSAGDSHSSPNTTLRGHLDEARDIRKELKAAEESGKVCQKQATWIGLERYSTM
jgi:hypothetical protein